MESVEIPKTVEDVLDDAIVVSQAVERMNKRQYPLCGCDECKREFQGTPIAGAEAKNG